MAENLPTRARRQTPAAPTQVQVVETPPPPAHLSAEARRMWRDVAAEWVVGADAVPLLRAALESWDLYQSHRRAVAKTPTITSPSGMVRANPRGKLASDALREFRQCWRQLGLDPPR